MSTLLDTNVLSELLRAKPEAVVLGFADWQRLSNVPSFGRLLMAAPLDDGDVERNTTPVRDAGL